MFKLDAEAGRKEIAKQRCSKTAFLSCLDGLGEVILDVQGVKGQRICESTFTGSKSQTEETRPRRAR